MKCPLCEHKLTINRKQFFCPQCQSRFTSKINWFRFAISFVFALIIVRFIDDLCNTYQVAWIIKSLVFIIILALLICFYKVYLESWIQTIEKVD